MRIHLARYVEHMDPYYMKPYNISQHQNSSTPTVPNPRSDRFISILDSLNHGEHADSYGWSNPEDGLQSHESVRRHTVACLHSDVTTTEAFYKSTRRHTLLKNIH